MKPPERGNSATERFIKKEKGGYNSHNLRESGRKEKEKKRNSKGRNPGKKKKISREVEGKRRGGRAGGSKTRAGRKRKKPVDSNGL